MANPLYDYLDTKSASAYNADEDPLNLTETQNLQTKLDLSAVGNRQDKDLAYAKAQKEYEDATANPSYTSQSKASQVEGMARRAERRGFKQESQLLEQQAAALRLKEPRGLQSDAQRKRELGRLNPESFDAEGNRRSQLMPTRETPEPKKFSPLDLPFDNRLKFARDLSASKLITSGDHNAVGRALDRGAALGIDEDRILEHIQSLQTGKPSSGTTGLGTTASGNPFGEIDLSLESDATAAAAMDRANRQMPVEVKQATKKVETPPATTEKKVPEVAVPKVGGITEEYNKPVLDTTQLGKLRVPVRAAGEALSLMGNVAFRDAGAATTRLLDATARQSKALAELDVLKNLAGKTPPSIGGVVHTPVTAAQAAAREAQLVTELGEAGGEIASATKRVGGSEGLGNILKKFSSKAGVSEAGLVDVLKAIGAGEKVASYTSKGLRAATAIPLTASRILQSGGLAKAGPVADLAFIGLDTVRMKNDPAYREAALKYYEQPEFTNASTASKVAQVASGIYSSPASTGAGVTRAVSNAIEDTVLNEARANILKGQTEQMKRDAKRSADEYQQLQALKDLRRAQGRLIK